MHVKHKNPSPKLKFTDMKFLLIQQKMLIFYRYINPGPSCSKHC